MLLNFFLVCIFAVPFFFSFSTRVLLFYVLSTQTVWVLNYYWVFLFFRMLFAILEFLKCFMFLILYHQFPISFLSISYITYYHESISVHKFWIKYCISNSNYDKLSIVITLLCLLVKSQDNWIKSYNKNVWTSHFRKEICKSSSV